MIRRGKTQVLEAFQAFLEAQWAAPAGEEGGMSKGGGAMYLNYMESEQFAANAVRRVGTKCY